MAGELKPYYPTPLVSPKSDCEFRSVDEGKAIVWEAIFKKGGKNVIFSTGFIVSDNWLSFKFYVVWWLVAINKDKQGLLNYDSR